MKISKKLLLYIILLLPFIKPMLFQYIDSINKIYYILKIIAGVYIILLYIKQRKISKITICVLVYQLIIIISTIINNGNILQSVGIAMVNISLCMITEIMINDNVDYMFQSYIKILDVFLIINTISLFVFPHGCIPNRDEDSYVYFLGIDNRFIFFYLPLICLRFCYSNYKYGKVKLNDIFVYFICLFTLLYRWSAGAMVGLLLYVPFLLFIYKNRKIGKVLNLYTYVGGIGVANYLIVIEQIQYKFADFIVNVLHKDPTFTMRTFIWDKTVSWIKLSPIYGYGQELEMITKQKIHGANHPHNYVLTILYRGGFLLLGVFVLILLMVSNSLRKCKDIGATSIISFTILVSLIMCIVDSFDFALFFVILTLGYNVDKIINKRGEK